MLLDSEVKAGEIYVYDSEMNFGDENPSLWQIVEMPKEVEFIGEHMERHTEMSNPTWENIYTGELVTWGTHCFTTIERMKKQFFNIDRIGKKHRSEYVKKAFELILDYETCASSVQDERREVIHGLHTGNIDTLRHNYAGNIRMDKDTV